MVPDGQSEILCPPYWELAICAIACVAILHAVEKLFGLVDHRLTDNRAVLEHILQIYQTAVMHMLCKIICIMEMNDSLLMRFYDILRQ